jgi:hypothetical protein
MDEEKIYVFKVALRYRKGLWRRIEIKGNQTLGNFDRIIRKAFKHDLGDHMSEFFPGRAWKSKGFGEIDPDGGGSGAKKQIYRLRLSEGDTIEYVYDFGDDIQHIITLEKVAEPEKDIKYPLIVSKNRSRYRYCESCKNQGKKTIATWVCIECSNENGKEVLICEDCLEKEHEYHYAEEIVY